MPESVYETRAAKRRTPAGSYDLWLTNDHLLLVVRHWWTERYQRFRYADIASIAVYQRPSWKGAQVAGLIVTGLLLATVLFDSSSPFRRFFLGPLLSLVVIVQLADLIRGPYCRVFLNTAVSSVQLPAISRMPVALSFVNRITPMIDGAQGGRWEPGTEAAASLEPPVRPAAAEVTPPRRVTEWIFAASMLTLGIYTIFSSQRAIPSTVVSLGWMLTLIPIALGGLAAFSNQSTVRRVVGLVGAAGGVLSGLTSLIGFASVIGAVARKEIEPNAIREYTAAGQGAPLLILGFVLIAAGIFSAFLAISAHREQPSSASETN